MVTMTASTRQRVSRSPRISQQQPVDRPAYDYSGLSANDVKRLEQAGERVRELTKRTLEVAVKIGKELIQAKEILGHGAFSRWLEAEFAWKPRMARNFMSVADRFKSARIADLDIVPTAAYMLAAPSTPEAACEEAIRRAQEGESISVSIAREIVERLRKEVDPDKPASGNTASSRLVNTLDRFRARWPKEELRSYAEELRRYAERILSELDEPSV